MSLTVREVVEHPRLGIRVLVTGDLDREVRWVHATEQADPTPYLRGGEIVLTDGLWLDGPRTADEYVRRLRDIGIAAIGYGPMPETPTVPEILVEACARHDVCLFAMPPTLPYLAVSEVFVDRVAEDREAALAARVARNARFLDTARSGGGAEALVRLLEDETGLAAWIAGGHGQLLARGGHRPEAEDVATVTAVLERRRLPGPAGRWWLEPIAAVDVPRGYLVIADDPPMTGEQRAIVEQALPFLGMELAHAWALRQGQRQLAAELVELVMAGEAQAGPVAARLTAAGFGPGTVLAVLVCEGGEPAGVLDAAEAVLTEEGLRCLAAAKQEQVVLVAQCPADPDELPALAARLHARIGTTVGVGSPAHDAATLRTSLAEARHACRLAAARRDGLGHGSYADIGSYRLLLDVQHHDVLSTFAAALLDPILDYDRRNHAQLLTTLTRFLELDCQWQETAEALHVHVNTLRNRLTRIEELVGRPLRATETRVDLFLAVRAAGDL